MKRAVAAPGHIPARLPTAQGDDMDEDDERDQKAKPAGIRPHNPFLRDPAPAPLSPSPSELSAGDIPTLRPKPPHHHNFPPQALPPKRSFGDCRSLSPQARIHTSTIFFFCCLVGVLLLAIQQG